MTDLIETLWRRLLMVIGMGRITVGDDSGNVQLQQVKLGQDEVRDNVPRVAEYGFTSAPPAGSEAVVIFAAGDRSDGVIVATVHQASRLKNLKAGEMAIFDDQGQSVYLTRAGIVINGANLPITVNNTPKLIVNAASEVDMNTPLLRVSGDIIDNSATNAHTMAQMRTIFNGHNHNVSGVQAGSSTVTTNVPNQTE